MTAIAWRATTWDGPSRDLAVVTAVALPLAVAFPVATSIVGLAVFGVAHTVLELRWVLARFRPLLTTPLLVTATALATVIAIARLTGAPKPVEITAGFGILAAGIVFGRLPSPLALLTIAGLAASLHTPAAYGIVLAHLHNLVTGVLLWEWAGAERPKLRAGLVLAFALVPAALLLAPPPTIAHSGPSHLLAAGVGLPLVSAFAYMQLLHYGVWCWLLPRRAPLASGDKRALPHVVPVALATAILAFLFRTDYATGRTLYSSLATYHAYLEFPVVLALLGGARVPR